MKNKILLIFLIFFYKSIILFSQDIIPVKVYKVKKGELYQKYRTLGEIHPFKKVVVFSKVRGTIEKLLVDVGDKVKKGDKIAEIEHNLEKAQRKELLVKLKIAEINVKNAKIKYKIAKVKFDYSKKVYEQAKINVKIAEHSLKRVRVKLDNITLEKNRVVNLFKEKAIPKQKYDNVISQYKEIKEAYESAQTNIENAKLQVKIAKTNVDLAKANLLSAEIFIEQAKVQVDDIKASIKKLDVVISNYIIRAPISGIINKKIAEEGSMNTPMQPIVEIVNIDKVKIITQIPENYVNYVNLNTQVNIRLDAYPNKVFNGKINKIYPTLKYSTRTLPLEIHLSNKSYIFKPGLLARIELILQKKSLLLIPKDCILRFPTTGVMYVFKIHNNIAYKISNLKIEESEGNIVGVKEGRIKEGMLLVISGYGRLKSNMKVKIIKIIEKIKK